MLAAIHDLSAEQNSEYTVTFQYFNSADAAIGILANYNNVRFVVRRSSLPQEKNLFEVSYDNNVVEGYLPFLTSESYGSLVITNQQMKITVDTDTMSSVYPGNYFYYVFLETNSGVSDCLIRGKFTVEAP
jgi:hypothetical protein